MGFNPKRWILPAIITVVLVAAWWYGATRPIEVDVPRSVCVAGAPSATITSGAINWIC